MQKVRCNFFKNKLQLIVSTKFQYLFQIFYRSISPFPHGTYSLSIIKIFSLDFEGGPPFFKQYTTDIVLLIYHKFKK